MWESFASIGTVLVAVFTIFATWPELWFEFRDLVERLSMNLIYGSSGLYLGATSGNGTLAEISLYIWLGCLALGVLIYAVIPRVVLARTGRNPYERPSGAGQPPENK